MNKARVQSFPAPVRGLIENENPVAAKGSGASVLENWVPTVTGIRMRGGALEVNGIGSQVFSLFSYSSPIGPRLFAATDTKIVDVSALDGTSIDAVTGQSGGRYSAHEFSTGGGDFLYVVNGVDNPQIYDGTSWQEVTGASSPIAMTGATLSDFSHVWAYRNRAFFVKSGSLSVFYLPTDSVGGALTEISLYGIFKTGGKLLFGGTWSLDSGDGIDDKVVFVSDTGEVAVYQGDPSDANQWDLVGVYDITDPLGPNATLRAGGDLLIATQEGFMPISEVIKRDPAALTLAAVSRQIEPSWRQWATGIEAQPWEVVKWPERNIALVSVPNSGNLSFVVNLQTGAWAKVTGWDVQCMARHNGQVYFGSVSGKIFAADEGGQDDGMPYVCKYSGLPDHSGRMAQYKQAQMARATFRSGTDFKSKVSLAQDYSTTFPSAPNAASVDADSLWDSALWDAARWDAGSTLEGQTVTTRWQSVAGAGTALAPQVQIASSSASKPYVSLLHFDLMFVSGGYAV